MDSPLDFDRVDFFRTLAQQCRRQIFALQASPVIYGEDRAERIHRLQERAAHLDRLAAAEQPPADQRAQPDSAGSAVEAPVSDV